MKIYFDIVIENDVSKDELNNELEKTGIDLDTAIAIARLNFQTQLNELSTNGATFKVLNGRAEF